MKTFSSLQDSAFNIRQTHISSGDLTALYDFYECGYLNHQGQNRYLLLTFKESVLFMPLDSVNPIKTKTKFLYSSEYGVFGQFNCIIHCITLIRSAGTLRFTNENNSSQSNVAYGLRYQKYT